MALEASRARPRRIAMLGYGSRGDIQPLLVLGDELARRGHSVRLTVNTNLVEWARRSGLEIVPIEPDVDAFLKSPEGRRMLSDGRATTFSRELGRREDAANRQITRACMECCEGADRILSTILTGFRATAIAEKMGVAHRVLATMPVQPTAEYAQLLSPVRRLPSRFLNHLTYDVMMSLWWRSFSAAQAETRGILGLASNTARPRVERLPSIGIYSETLSARPSDWGPQHQVTGFLAMPSDLRTRLGEAACPPGLEEWLDAGDPPVYFGFGSLPVLDPPALLRQVATVTRARGLRALIGAGWTDYGDPSQLHPHMFVAPAFDHERILPRCIAAVHHGGAGTTAAALRAGLPSLVVSVFADQPFWGWLVQECGVGATVPYRRLDAATLGRLLGRILLPTVRARAQVLGRTLRAEDGAKAAADVIEAW